MSTSGVTTNQLTRNQIIESAMRKIGVLAIGQTPTTEDYTNATLAFNALIGEFRALGLELWTRTTYNFGLTTNVSSYNIGSGQTLNTPYPIKMLQAYRTDTGNTTRIPMEIVPNYNFNLFPASSGGRPIQITYQPKVNYGVIQVWPVPDADANTNSTVNIVYTRPIEYMVSSTDTIDFPEEWVQPIIYNLAVRLAPEWGIPLPDRQQLMKEAQMYLENALGNGAEDGSFYFQPYSRP